jgi:large subunit ribosomal protein L1
VDKTGIINSSVGKMSFENDKLADNARDFIKAVIKAKPVALKGKYVLSVYLSSTMSPSVKLGAQQFES